MNILEQYKEELRQLEEAKKVHSSDVLYMAILERIWKVQGLIKVYEENPDL